MPDPLTAKDSEYFEHVRVFYAERTAAMETMNAAETDEDLRKGQQMFRSAVEKIERAVQTK